MDTDRFENQVYFDTSTGEIIHIPVELNENNVYDEEYVAGLPKWEKEMIAQVKAVRLLNDKGYIINTLIKG